MTEFSHEHNRRVCYFAVLKCVVHEGPAWKALRQAREASENSHSLRSRRDLKLFPCLRFPRARSSQTGGRIVVAST